MMVVLSWRMYSSQKNLYRSFSSLCVGEIFTPILHQTENGRKAMWLISRKYEQNSYISGGGGGSRTNCLTNRITIKNLKILSP